MSLIYFWPLNVVVAVLSTQGQKVLRFHQKCVFLFVFRKWTMVLHVLDDGILFLEWTIPLIDLNQVGYDIGFYMDENNAVVDKLTVLQWHALFKGPILTTDLWCFYLQNFFWKMFHQLNNRYVVKQQYIHWPHCSSISHSLVFIPVGNEIRRYTD